MADCCLLRILAHGYTLLCRLETSKVVHHLRPQLLPHGIGSDGRYLIPGLLDVFSGMAGGKALPVLLHCHAPLIHCVIQHMHCALSVAQLQVCNEALVAGWTWCWAVETKPECCHTSPSCWVVSKCIVMHQQALITQVLAACVAADKGK